MTSDSASRLKRNAYVSIVLFGIVSLMGDIVYEGSRGAVPEYLAFLGATGFVVVLVGGLGDFLGYAMRLISGFLVDETRAYWFFIFLGYGLIVSIPLLGVSSSLEIAVLLVLLERFGKAFRSPSRDTVLSIVSKEVGAGKAFGLHELLDQLGAVLGPAIVAFLLFFGGNNYRYAFTFLFIPFLLVLVFLMYTRSRIGSKEIAVSVEKEQAGEKMPRPFIVYVLAVVLNTVGFVPYTLILLKASEIVRPLGQDWIVPLIYLLIQGVDAPVALLSGYAFDKIGVRILLVPFVLSVFPPLLALLDSGLLILILAAALFGLVLGMQESIYRAAVSKFAPLSFRGTAYGLFHTLYGVGLLTSGVVYGLLVQFSMPFSLTVVYVVPIQIAATFLLLRAANATRTTL